MVMSAGYAMSAETEYRQKEMPQQKKKEKRPGFLAKFLFKKLMEGAEYEKREKERQEMNMPKVASLSIGSRTSEIENQEKSIQFTVHIANGGRVIETRRYDRQKDRHTNGLYVITSDQDFGKEIDKIITMESLK